MTHMFDGHHVAHVKTRMSATVDLDDDLEIDTEFLAVIVCRVAGATIDVHKATGDLVRVNKLAVSYFAPVDDDELIERLHELPGLWGRQLTLPFVDTVEPVAVVDVDEIDEVHMPDPIPVTARVVGSGDPVLRRFLEDPDQ